MTGRSSDGKPVVPPQERPDPPWGKLPLSEIAIFAGLVLVVIGMITSNPTPLFMGLLVASVGGLELAIREHFSGYRSHTTLLAAVGGVTAALAVFFLLDVDHRFALVAGAVVLVSLFFVFRRAFVRASGGLAWRIR